MWCLPYLICCFAGRYEQDIVDDVSSMVNSL